MASSNVVIKWACMFSILVYLALVVATPEEKRGISDSSKMFIRHVLSCLNDYTQKFMRLISSAVLTYESFGPIIGSDHLVALEPQVLLVEDLIFWDPMVFLPGLSLMCPSCTASERLKGTRWKDGEKSHDQPRRIYGLKNEVLVVSRVYTCANRHQIIAHDPGVLSQLKGMLTPAFILFHKGGITRELYDFIITHMLSGLSTTEIQVLWHQTMFTDYVRKRGMYLERLRVHSAISGTGNSVTESPIFPVFDYKHQRPGGKIITACILWDYYENEPLYSKRMCQMTAKKWVSCDHTFKVAANIGFWWNKSWVKVYDSLFLIMNENGIVLTWRLCKGTNFNAVEDLLQNLKQRLDAEQESIDFIFLDNCCHWSKKLYNIFPSVEVKLDTFHAVQRIVKKVPKRGQKESILKQMRRNMRKDLRFIIRHPEDRGPVRTRDTPAPEIITQNIDMFLKQWGSVKIENILVLPAAAVKKIADLRKHVVKGCLSHIPPSGGTHRNEALHKTLKKSIANSRIGIQLAVALLGIFFYKWNEQRLTKHDKENKMSVIKPVGFYEAANNTQEKFMKFGTVCGSSLNDTNNLALEFETDSITLENLLDTFNCVKDVPACELNEESSSDGTDCSSDNDNDASTEQSSVLKKEAIVDIIQQTSDMVSICNYLQSAHSDVSFHPHHGVYLKNTLHLLHQSRNCSHQSLLLNSVLSTHGLHRICVPADGNCFFMSVAVGIHQQILMNTLVSAAKEHLDNLGLLNISVSEMAERLRTIIVNEWLTYPQEYAPFLTNKEITGSFTAEANAFLQDGHFSSSLGDSMPLATANMLGIPIIIFSGMQNLPIVPLLPRRRALSLEPLKLAYDASLCGHYDAVTTVQAKEDDVSTESSNSNPSEKSVSSTCRCGQGAKKGKKSFVSCNEFRSGCPCFQKVQGCSDSCNCLNCENKFGKKKSSITPPEGTGKRKRQKHEMTTQNTSGKMYWDRIKGNPGINQWTLFEELILLHILDVLSSKVMLTPEDITLEFNEIVKVVQKTEFSKHLMPKSLQQISQKVTTLQKNKKVFDTLVEEQEKLNLDV